MDIDFELATHQARMTGDRKFEGNREDGLYFLARCISELRGAVGLLLELERQRRKDLTTPPPGGWN